MKKKNQEKTEKSESAHFRFFFSHIFKGIRREMFFFFILARYISQRQITVLSSKQANSKL